MTVTLTKVCPHPVVHDTSKLQSFVAADTWFRAIGSKAKPTHEINIAMVIAGI